MPTKDPAKIAAKQKRYREKKIVALVDNPDDRMHGSLSGYSVGCRCHRCTATYSDWRRLRRQ